MVQFTISDPTIDGNSRTVFAQVVFTESERQLIQQAGRWESRECLYFGDPLKTVPLTASPFFATFREMANGIHITFPYEEDYAVGVTQLRRSYFPFVEGVLQYLHANHNEQNASSPSQFSYTVPNLFRLTVWYDLHHAYVKLFLQNRLPSNIEDEPVLLFKGDQEHVDIYVRKEHSNPSLTIETCRAMIPVRGGYALTLSKLIDGFAFGTHSQNWDTHIISKLFAPGGECFTELERHIRLCQIDAIRQEQQTAQRLEKEAEREERKERERLRDAERKQREEEKHQKEEAARLEHEEKMRVREPDIPEELWYKHVLLLATTQGGKTNILRWRLDTLIPRVAKGAESVVLMDAKGRLFNELVNLEYIYKMKDRVIIIEPDPDDISVAVNIFEPTNNLDQDLARATRIINTITSTLTGFQEATLYYTLRALYDMGETPTLRSISRILRLGIKGLPANVHQDVQDYFEHDFEPKNAEARRLVQRFGMILSSPVFEPLFSADRTTFDMFEETQKGKLILINCSNVVETYGKYWIQEVNRTISKRYAMGGTPTPTTFIIDEAQRFISEDLHFADILDRAAESKLSVVLAMQHMGQIRDDQVKGSVYDNTNLKFASHTTADIHNLCRAMGNLKADDQNFIMNPPPYVFAHYRPGLPHAVWVKFPLVDFTKYPRMNTEQHKILRHLNRKRYGYAPTPTAPDTVAEVNQPAPQAINDDNEPVQPKAEPGQVDTHYKRRT